MIKLVGAFLLAAALGAAVTAASPTHAAYGRMIHAHSCIPVPLDRGEYGDSRLFAKTGQVVASCPIPDDYTSSLTQTSAGKARTSADNNLINATVTVYANDPTPAAMITAQFCSTRKNQNSSYCTVTKSTSDKTSGYQSLSVTGLWPADSSSLLPTLWVTLPQGAWLNGFSVQLP